MPTHRLPLLALAAAAGLGGCALRADSAALLSEAPARSAPECRVAEEPRLLPAAGALVDAPAFLADATALWKAHGRPTGHVLFSLRYDRDGTNVRRAVLEHGVDAALADSLQRLVFAHRRAVAPAEEEWGVRLRLDLGETPLLRVGRREICPPRPRDVRLALVTGRGPSGWDVRSEGGESPDERVWLRVAVDAGGMVTDARVERGRATELAGRRALGAVRGISFLPAMEDGYPVPGELSIALPGRVLSGHATR